MPFLLASQTIRHPNDHDTIKAFYQRSVIESHQRNYERAQDHLNREQHYPFDCKLAQARFLPCAYGLDPSRLKANDYYQILGLESECCVHLELKKNQSPAGLMATLGYVRLHLNLSKNFASTWNLSQREYKFLKLGKVPSQQPLRYHINLRLRPPHQRQPSNLQKA